MATTFLSRWVDANYLNGPLLSFGDGAITVADTTTVQTLTNKTLTAPTITGAAGITDTITTDTGDNAIPITGGTVVFTKGTSSTHTLAAPATLGITLTLYAGSAVAHVITATGLIDNGVTGGSKTTITLASFIGSNIVLKSVQAGKWGVVASNTVTSVA